MSDEPKRGSAVDPVRRKLLKAGAVAGGALAAGLVPYEKPAIKSFFGTRSAWAQLTGALRISFDGQLGTLPPGDPDSTGQDRWEFEVLEANTQLTIQAVPDAFLDIEIYLYAPGAVGPGETNLLSGDPFGLSGGGVGASEGAGLTVAAAGVYTFAIEDERAPGLEQAGTYMVTIDGDKPLGPPTQVEDDGPESDLRSGPADEPQPQQPPRPDPPGRG